MIRAILRHQRERIVRPRNGHGNGLAHALGDHLLKGIGGALRLLLRCGRGLIHVCRHQTARKEQPAQAQRRQPAQPSPHRLAQGRGSLHLQRLVAHFLRLLTSTTAPTTSASTGSVSTMAKMRQLCCAVNAVSVSSFSVRTGM